MDLHFCIHDENNTDGTQSDGGMDDSEDGKKKYSTNKVFYIRSFYILAIVLWIVLIAVLRLYLTDLLGLIILLLPLLIFFFGFYNAPDLSRDIEDEIFRANFLSIGLIIILPLLTWMNQSFSGDKKRFFSILAVALILSMVSVLDVWTKRGWLSVTRHVKSSLQTISLALFIYAIYEYYRNFSIPR